MTFEAKPLGWWMNMDVIKRPSEQKTMAYALRPLDYRDIPQVAEIEREAFSSTWPTTSFKRELQNRNSAYLVAFQPQEVEARPAEGPLAEGSGQYTPLVGRVVSAFKELIGTPRQPSQHMDRILGFVGLWFMGSEAHITAIAVRQEIQGQGIGELLLIGSIEVATKRQTEVVSLEVRVSNQVAQSLYQKYGFHHAGLRKGYYNDNREDAAIMTTQPIDTAEYQEKFRQLCEAYRQRHGEIRICLA